MIRLSLLALLVTGVVGVGSVTHFIGTISERGHGALRASADPIGCQKPSDVVDIGFSKTKYPHIREHVEHAIDEGWPRVVTIHRAGAADRRERALEGIPTRRGYDRDEWPAAVLRSSWKTDVAYVPSSENRSQGSALGTKLRRYCSGTRVRYVWY